MKSLWTFDPDLRAFELEDRILPDITNLGVIVLTTGGHVLVDSSPGVVACRPVLSGLRPADRARATRLRNAWRTIWRPGELH
jgi:hypothetical protein